MSALKTITIASWNINSIKARAGHVEKWLGAARPDILMIQELKGLSFETSAFEAAGYQTVYVGQKAYNGVAILSRQPIEVVQNALPGDAEDVQARFLEVNTCGLRVINIYAPNGNPVDTEKFPYKLNWLARLRTHLKDLRARRIQFLIGGDFNVIPENKDCFDPALWRGDALGRPETRRVFRSIINLGLTDAFRVFDGAAGRYTFWDYQAGCWPANKGIRIDHFLCSPEITDRLVSCTIDAAPRGWDSPSDHTPVVMTVSG